MVKIEAVEAKISSLDLTKLKPEHQKMLKKKRVSKQFPVYTSCVCVHMMIVSPIFTLLAKMIFSAWQRKCFCSDETSTQ